MIYSATLGLLPACELTTFGSFSPELDILKGCDLSSCSKNRWDLKEIMDFDVWAHSDLLYWIEKSM